MIGDWDWLTSNPNRWGICNWNWEDGENTTYTEESWVAIWANPSDPIHSTYHHFYTHEVATNFVRSEIDSLRTSD